MYQPLLGDRPVEVGQRLLLGVTGRTEGRAQRRLDLRLLGALDVHEAAVDHAGHEAGRLRADRERTRRCTGSVCTAANTWSVDVAVTKFIVMPTSASWLWMATWSSSGWPSTVMLNSKPSGRPASASSCLARSGS